MAKNRNPYIPSLKDQQTSFSALLDAIDPDQERQAQRQKYLKQMKEEASKEAGKKSQSPKKAAQKAKGESFEEKLERTNQWLRETFPHLFDPSQPCKALDEHIVRDIKDHYKKYRIKEKYPSDLAIKAALYRYMESPAYLVCLVEGAPRYNVKGEIVGTVVPSQL